MRLTIDHSFRYRFDRPRRRLVQLLRVTPEDTHDQTVASWRIDVDCDARLRTTRDGFGNIVTMLYAEGPLDGLQIILTGEVLTSEAPGVLTGALDPLPPAVFCRPTAASMADGRVMEFARGAATGRSALDRLHALNSALHRRFRVTSDQGYAALSVSQAFGARAIDPHNLAQIFVAAARSCGHPARCVTGYCLSGFGGAQRPMPHGWAEAFVADLGWVSFDPSFGLTADENYVRVAVGLDTAGAMPVAETGLGHMVPLEEECATGQ